MSDFIKHLFETPEKLLYGNTIADWIAAGVIAIAVWSLLWFVRSLVASRYKRYLTGEHPTAVRLLAYLVGNTRQILFLALALYAGKESVTLPAKVERNLSNAILILILLQVGLWAGRCLRFYLELKEKDRGPDRSFAGSLDIMQFLKENNLLKTGQGRDLDIQPCKWLVGRGAGGADRMVAYTQEEDRVRYPLVPLQRTPVEYRSIYQLTTYFGRLGCVEFVYPETVQYADGI